MSTSAAEFNTKLVDEFRANQGRVTGVFEGTPLLVLHHTGAKSAEDRITPIAYLGDNGRYVVIASNGGAPTSPHWYHNLKAQPRVTIEVGTQTIDVVASEATGEERERLFRTQAERFPQLTEYEQKTDRVIPVIVLTPDALYSGVRAAPRR
jgi:deazaflavin-dependent oxidoreductase (nitroreductase family)